MKCVYPTIIFSAQATSFIFNGKESRVGKVERERVWVEKSCGMDYINLAVGKVIYEGLEMEFYEGLSR